MTHRHTKDLVILPDHGIVFDPVEHDYYNRRSDIFLSEDDVKFYNLRSLSEVPRDLPPQAKTNPHDYFITK